MSDWKTRLLTLHSRVMTILARIVGVGFVIVGGMGVLLVPLTDKDPVVPFLLMLFALVSGILLLRAKRWEPEDVDNLFRRRK